MCYLKTGTWQRQGRNRRMYAMGRSWVVVVNICRRINLRIHIITIELTTLYKVVNSCHYIYPASFFNSIIPIWPICLLSPLQSLSTPALKKFLYFQHSEQFLANSKCSVFLNEFVNEVKADTETQVHNTLLSCLLFQSQYKSVI